MYVGLRFYMVDRSSQHNVVGAMIYLSPKLTLVMLSVVPPIALGSVRIPEIKECFYIGYPDKLRVS